MGSRMKRGLLTVFLFVVLLLSACAPPASLPSAVVMLTSSWPDAMGRCTGVVVGPTRVLTARHCLNAVRRVVTPWGQEAFVTRYFASPDADIALLEVDRTLWVPGGYAQFGEARRDIPGRLFGVCPFYWGHQARYALYRGDVSVEMEEGQPEVTVSRWLMARLSDDQQDSACGGDSGGVIMQEGKVVGITSAVESELWFVAIGRVVYSVPQSKIKELFTLANE